MGYISRRLKRRLSRAGQRGASLGPFRSLVRQVEGDIGSPRSLRRMSEYHPNHAAYLAAQNMVSFLAEELSALPEMREYARVVGPAEEEYLPEGPPMSPLTLSYFTTWAFFDAAFGRDWETIGTCLLDLGPDLGLSPDYLEVIRQLQRSYVSVYEHHGVEGKRVHLQELISNRSYTCVVPAGYLGRAGDWIQVIEYHKLDIVENGGRVGWSKGVNQNGYPKRCERDSRPLWRSPTRCAENT